MLAWLPVAVVAALSLGASAVAAYAPPASGQMAIVFAPGTASLTAYRAIIAAGGAVVGPTRFDNVVVAYALDADFLTRVQARGGWFAVAARGLCAPPATISPI